MSNVSPKTIEALEKYWASDAAIDSCRRLVAYISRTPTEDMRVMTYRNIADILGKTIVDDELLRALAILTNSPVRLLEARSFFTDKNDGREFDLSPEETATALRRGAVVHPETGELVPDAKKNLVPFFAVTEESVR